MNEYRYEDISVGSKETFTVTVTAEMLDSFKTITGDVNPLHADCDFAVQSGYEGRVAYGMLTASFLSTLAGVYLPGKYSLIHNVSVDFPKPVFIGDVLEITGEVVEKNDLYKCFIMKVTIKNQNGKKVCRGKMQVGVKE